MLRRKRNYAPRPGRMRSILHRAMTKRCKRTNELPDSSSASEGSDDMPWRETGLLTATFAPSLCVRPYSLAPRPPISAASSCLSEDDDEVGCQCHHHHHSACHHHSEQQDEPPELVSSGSDDDGDDSDGDEGDDSEDGDGDDDDNSDDRASMPCRSKPKGTAGPGYLNREAAAYRKREVGAKAAMALSDDQWEITPDTNGSKDRSGWANMLEKATGTTFSVKWSRVAKAKAHLGHDACAGVMKLKTCECSRSCQDSIKTIAEIRSIRQEIFCDCESSIAVKAALVSKFKSTKGVCSIVTRSGDQIVGKTVCRKYFAALHGVALAVVRQALQIARMDGCAPKARASVIGQEAPKYTQALAFWTTFFENHCQRPNDTERIFPTEKTYEEIYDEYFLPWFDRVYAQRLLDRCPESVKRATPSLSTWKEARKSPEFADVKPCKKHTHGRCHTCAKLKTLLLESFKSGTAEREYQQQRRMHDEEVLRWRKLETVVKARVADSPGEEILIVHDGTVKLGLPRISRRTLKNLNPARFDVVPWLASDHGAARNDYIYAPNASTSKDVNYLLSQFHAVIRRAKSDYTHPRHRARRLTIIADSASENKNNILFTYYTDMVVNGWFDSIELLFGPVGHTHNGVDATHKIHNVDVGQCVSGDLGHYVLNYPKGFSGRASMKTPEASILGRIVDWKAYYDPVIRRISGFTKTSGDPLIVRGFRIAKQRDGSVDVRWKADPANESEWRGVGGFGNQPGFHMRMAAPLGLPGFVGPSTVLQSESHKKHGDVLGKPQGLQEALRPQNLVPCAAWCMKAHLEGKIPIHRYLEDIPPPTEWGRLCEVGAVENHRGRMREIVDFWDPKLPIENATLWKLPVCPKNSHLEATTNVFHYSRDAAILSSSRIPLVRYANERVRNAEVSRHPNNMGGNGWVPEHADAKESKEDADGSHVSQGEEEATGSEAQEAQDRGTHDAPEMKEPLRRYEEELSGCKKGSMVVGMAEARTGPSPYIFVGKIVETQPEAKPYPTFTMVSFVPTKDNWTEACIGPACKWHKHSSDRVTKPHYSVMKYFPNLNKSNTLPAAVRSAINEREIEWHESDVDTE